MSTTHEITDSTIQDRIDAIHHTDVEWANGTLTGHKDWGLAVEILRGHLTVIAVRLEMVHHIIMGESPEQEAEMAISLACRPRDLPGNGCVAIAFLCHGCYKLPCDCLPNAERKTDHATAKDFAEFSESLKDPAKQAEYLNAVFGDLTEAVVSVEKPTNPESQP